MTIERPFFPPREELWHRRQALMIASQLPEQPEDALAVLRAAMQIVTGFLAEPEAAPKPGLTVVPIKGNDCA